MPDLEDLARREGEGWARARLAQLRQMAGPIPEAWPGHVAFAYMVAEDMADTGVIRPRDVRKLAERINDHAVRAWTVITRRTALAAGH